MKDRHKGTDRGYVCLHSLRLGRIEEIRRFRALVIILKGEVETRIDQEAEAIVYEELQSNVRAQTDHGIPRFIHLVKPHLFHMVKPTG